MIHPMWAARILVAGMLVSCWSGSHPPAPAEPAPTPVPVDAPPEPEISLVTSVVVFDQCPDSKRIDTRKATKEIDELVGPCKKVPGGAAHFAAILMPGGEVDLASPAGDQTEGVVPTCLLQHKKQLRHKLRLTQACRFDVKLEQRVAGQP